MLLLCDVTVYSRGRSGEEELRRQVRRQGNQPLYPYSLLYYCSTIVSSYILLLLLFYQGAKAAAKAPSKDWETEDGDAPVIDAADAKTVPAAADAKEGAPGWAGAKVCTVRVFIEPLFI